MINLFIILSKNNEIIHKLDNCLVSGVYSNPNLILDGHSYGAWAFRP